jgi:hypothetical protein
MTARSTFPRCWRKPTMRSIAPRIPVRNRVEIASIELILDRAKRGAADLLAAASGRASAVKAAAKSAA